MASATIGNGLSIIWGGTFHGCLGLTSVSIGSNVEKIGVGTFRDCWSVMELICNAQAPPACEFDTRNGVDDALYGLDKENCILYVPVGTESDYRTADQWKDFAHIVEMPASGIESITKGEQDGGPQIYDLGGRRLDNLQKGRVNIVRMSDGTAKKVMVK